jgi:hypothetical protein
MSSVGDGTAPLHPETVLLHSIGAHWTTHWVLTRCVFVVGQPLPFTLGTVMIEVDTTGMTPVLPLAPFSDIGLGLGRTTCRWAWA